MRILLVVILALIFSVFINSYARASQSFEMVGGGLTYHLCCDSMTSQKFTTKLADDGRLIFNPITGLKYTVSDGLVYTSIAGFAGQNSIGYNMQGALLGFGADLDTIRFGFAAGGYIQDSSEFARRGIIMGVGGDFMPVIGVEVSFLLYRIRDYYIRQNNLINYFITNHTLSFGWDI